MMHTARQVAEYLLSLSDPEIGELTSNLKLQKLLYYAQGVHLAAFDVPLFAEDIVAWNYGPVVESVYQAFKIFQSGPILIPYNPEQDVLPRETKQFIDQVYGYFGQYSALKLMQLTHGETPWQITPRMQVISQDVIRSYFKTQAYVATIAFPTQAQRLRNAALRLLADYENDEGLTDMTRIDTDNWYAYEAQ